MDTEKLRELEQEMRDTARNPFANTIVLTTFIRDWSDKLRDIIAAQPPKAELGQEVGAVACRGYAKLGIGGYLIEHSAESEPAALMLCIASEEEKAGRTVGDLKTFEGERQPIPAEKMTVRIDFAYVAGLDALEQQLRILREVHFPTSPAHTSDARDAVPVKVPAPRYIDCPCCSSQEDHRHQCMPYFAAMRQEAE